MTTDTKLIKILHKRARALTNHMGYSEKQRDDGTENRAYWHYFRAFAWTEAEHLARRASNAHTVQRHDLVTDRYNDLMELADEIHYRQAEAADPHLRD